MTKGKKVSVAQPIAIVPEQPKGYEGSYEDMQQDYAGAKRKGISVAQYEDSAEDRIQDKAGEKRMREKDALKEQSNSADASYKPGQSHFKNVPKTSHGYGHKGNQRQGSLRVSGHAGAHQIGKRK